MFISSPSKSALYGDVTDKLSRNVEYGRIRTRCPCKQHTVSTLIWALQKYYIQHLQYIDTVYNSICTVYSTVYSYSSKVCSTVL